MANPARVSLNFSSFTPAMYRHTLRALHLKHQTIEDKIGALMTQRADVEDEIAEAQKAIRDNGIRL